MKILLLSVNSEAFFYDQAVIPFGLASLGSAAQQAGHDVIGIDMNVPAKRVNQRYLKVDKELLNTIISKRPSLVAMTAYSDNIHNVLFWADLLKQHLPDTVIALGGNHASYISRDLLTMSAAVDFVLRFEGDYNFVELCNVLQNDQADLSLVSALAWRNSQHEIIENPVSTELCNLDELPSLDYGIFSEHHLGQYHHADFITARGCPFHCTFCNCNHYWHKTYRTISVSRIIEELKRFKAENPQLRTVRFRDESISIQRKRCLELCEALIKADLGLEYHAHSRLDGLDEDIIAHLAQAGFKQLYIGFESASPTVLARLRKEIDPMAVDGIVKALRKQGMGFRFSLIAGTPDERLVEVEETFAAIKRLNLSLDEFYFTTGLIIYPGTAICDDFYKSFPDYHWLKRHPLGNGYKQLLDSFGKVRSVQYCSPHYTSDEFHASLNTALQPLLNQYGEVDYQDYKATWVAVNHLQHYFSDALAMRTVVQAFFQKLGAAGRQWAVLRDGFFLRAMIGDKFNLAVQPGCAGVLTWPTLPDPALIGKIRTLDYIVLTLRQAEIKNLDMMGDLYWHWGFRGTLISLESYLQCVSENRWPGFDALSQIQISYRLPRRYYIRQALKWIRLYPLIKKLYRSFRPHVD